MQPSIPVPTDNLYKFMALFGLVLVVSSLFGMVLTGRSANAQIFDAARDYAQVDPELSPAKKAYADSLVKKASIAAEDRDVLIMALIIPLTVGMLLSYSGFARWKQIQPLHDELLRLQVERARKEAGLPPFSPAPPCSASTTGPQS